MRAREQQAVRVLRGMTGDHPRGVDGLRSADSYRYAGHQWALAIDAAAQVSAFRDDLADGVPPFWADVLQLARPGIHDRTCRARARLVLRRESIDAAEALATARNTN